MQGGKTISELNKFETRGNWDNTFNFHYNNYWPLDNYNPSKNYGLNEEYFKAIDSEGNEINKTKKGSSDDNSSIHNTAFGMRYDVNFDLDEYYKGPLRYFFSVMMICGFLLMETLYAT